MKLAVKLELTFVIGASFLIATGANAQRQMEKLGRGVVAVRTNDTTVYVGWRMLGTDPDDIGFNLYRFTSGGSTNKLNAQPLTNTTDFVDTTATLSLTNSYFVRPLINGAEQAASGSFVLPANAPAQQYISVLLEIPPGGTTPDGTNYTYTANDCSVGDLDGDGEYEIVLKWDPSNSQNSAYSGYTGNVFLDAYKLGVTNKLWRIDLGKNIRAGATYTQFIVYDLDGDGKAEIACKTAPGTKDGLGNYVLMPGDSSTNDYRGTDGRILTGPEYLTIFNGQTGAALVTTNYLPARGNVSDWGDDYGQRVDQLSACVAYLDGKRPSLITCRGYYAPKAGYAAKNELVAWNWRNGTLTNLWIFEAATNIDGNVNSSYIGQGNHNLSVGDVDGDGKDEIVYGACAINDDGTGLYSTGWGHGDAMHLSDMDPDRPGLEVWDVHETPNPTCGGGEFRDAKTGALIFGLPGTDDTGRGCAANITNLKGYQMWSVASGGLYNTKGKNIGRAPDPDNFLVWWDADVIRELLDKNYIDKYGTSSDTRLLTATECDSNNGTKANPCLSADILGDWREEVIWRTSATNNEIRIYTTTIPATNRFYTLMHDAQYRVSVAWQNVIYNQPPHPGFYLGVGMAQPPVPLVSDAKLVWHGDGVSNTWDATTTTNWYANWFLSGIWTSNTAAVFSQGDTVLFDMSGSNNVPINLVGTLTSAVVTVHSPTDYVFDGSGSLGGTATVVKAGPGTLTINTTNTYSGPTTVSDGTLWVNGRLDQSPVTVRGSLWGLGRIGGIGRLGQGLTMQAGASLIPGNGTNVAGTLTISNGLAETGGVMNYFDLSDDPTGTTKTNDLIVVNGNMTLNGQNIIQINMLNGSLPLNTNYPLFQYSGTLSGGLSNLTVNAISPSFTLGLTNMPGQIALLVISNRAPTSITWAGDDTANVCDTGLTANWLNGGVADRFFPLDDVKFDDTGSTNPSVNLVGILSPASVTVTATVDYTFSGSGSLTNPATLTKSGSGKLTISTLNSSTNRMTILAGTVQLGDGTSNDGNWSGSISNQASLIVANTGSFTMPGNISGGGSFTKDAAGTLTLTGTNTYSGTTTILAGTLQVGDGGTSGTLGTNDIVDNASLVFSRSDTFTNSAAISGPGSLTKMGSGILKLTGSNTYSGGTTVGGGALFLARNNAAGSGTITVSGSVQVGDGVLITNRFVSTGTTDAIIDCPSGTCMWMSAVSASGSAQFRPGTTGGTLVLTNLTGTLGGNYFFVPRGTVVFAGNTAISTTGTGLGFGRSDNNTVAVTIKDNASLSFANAPMGSGKNMKALSLTLTNSGALTFTAAGGANTFDLLNVSASTSTSTITLAGGTLTAGSLIKTSTGQNQAAILYFNGGVLKATASTTGFLNALSNLFAWVQAGGAKIDDGGFAITINQPLAHDPALGATPDGGLTKTSGGTLTLTGSNTYTGGTTVSNGTLLVNNTAGSGTGSGAVRVVGGATLGGCGTITGPVTIDPGGLVLADCGGTLTIGGTVTNNGGVMVVNGTTINFLGAVVNNGLINAVGGNVQFFSTLQNNGTVMTNNTTNVWLSVTSGKWETAGNWSLGQPSVVESRLLITNANSKTITIDDTTTNFPSTLTISNVTVLAPGGAANTLFLDNAGMAATLQVMDYVMLDGNGVMVVNNSAVQASEIDVGYWGGRNSLVISNGSQVISTYGIVGFNCSNSSVVVTGSGSVWSNSSEMYVGYDGACNSLVISNGSKVVSYDSDVGDFSSNNSVVVTGPGSVWSNSYNLYVCYFGSGNSLVISSSGQVVDVNACVGLGSGSDSTNSVVVTGHGSVWNNSDVLEISASGSLVISNGGQVLNNIAFVGSFSSNNSVLVADDAVWRNSMTLYAGYLGSSNSLKVAGGSVLATNLTVGFGVTASNNLVELDSGSLYVTNATADAVLEVRRGMFIQNGGTVTADQLVLTNGANSVIAFNGGTLNSSGTSVTNAQTFVVGNGGAVATYHLNGGIHSFNDGLRIRNNAVLSGCGTVTGAVVVDPGGTVLADCGGTLTFTGILTNNGTMRAINGTTLEFYGPVMNNGLINVISGNTNFHSTFINKGIVLDGAGDWDGDGMSNLQESLAGTDPTNSASAFRITSVAREANDVRVTWMTGIGRTNALQAAAGDASGGYSTNGFADLFIVTNTVGSVTNYLDVGGATNSPSRYYRIRLVP